MPRYLDFNRRQAITKLACLIGGGWLRAAKAVTETDTPGVSAGAILIGQSAALSGPARELGGDMNRGAQLYFHEVNRQGGIFDREIKLKVLDDAYEPDQAVRNTRKLIDEDRVFALFGYVGAPTSLAALPLVNQARIPFFAPFTGARALRVPQNRYIFHVRASYDDECAAIVRQITMAGRQRIFMAYNDGSYGAAGLEGIKTAIQAQPAGGAQLVGEHTLVRNTTDVDKAVRAALAQKPHAIVLVTAYTTAAAFIKAALAQDYRGQFYNVSVVGTLSLGKALGPQSAGVIVSEVMPYPGNATLPLIREYHRLLAAATPPGAYSYANIEGFVAAKVLVEGLRRAGRNLTRDRLIAALEGMGNTDLGGFGVRFAPSDHAGSKFVEMIILNGRGKVIH